MKNLRIYFWCSLTAILLSLGACQITEVTCDTECVEEWMDGGKHRDTCASDSNTDCLVSKRIAKPSAAQLARPVIIAAHGFGASTFEWKEFKVFADSQSDSVLVSMVLLGGHGRDIDTFRSTTWEDWGRPILTEYDSLVAKGYKNISFAGASTGATLILQAIADGAFSKKQSPNWFFFIDPIVIPSTKLLALANFVGPILGNSPNPGDSIENQHWYVNRPEENLRELYELTNRVKNHLEEGFKMPKGSRAKVYKATHDKLADPLGALLIYKGMRTSGGDRIETEMVDTRLHVFTRLEGRSGSNTADSVTIAARKSLRNWAFSQMVHYTKTVIPSTGKVGP
jgi:carboxylesterase